jgi:D-arabinose 1-dehydrogenase-like Zn-dependent alcohol dehydrogenase
MLTLGGKNTAGSLIADPSQIREMLELAVKEKIEPLVELRPMAEANQALVDMGEGKARYRYVLVN